MYAVDDWTILLVNFNYDGTGDDTFFWAGDSGRPGPQGFIVADQHGKLVRKIILVQSLDLHYTKKVICTCCWTSDYHLYFKYSYCLSTKFKC